MDLRAFQILAYHTFFKFDCAIALHEKFPNDCGLAEQSHTLHHCGVETTLHFARKLDPSYSKSDAEFVVKNCCECHSIDSSAVRINGRELSVEEDWKRLALNVTHHGCQKYLCSVPKNRPNYVDSQSHKKYL